MGLFQEMFKACDKPQNSLGGSRYSFLFGGTTAGRPVNEHTAMQMTAVYSCVMESFYRTVKRELVQGANYDNPEQARMDIFKYIETYYNTKRIHSALGYLSPTEFEVKKSLTLCPVFLDHYKNRASSCLTLGVQFKFTDKALLSFCL